MALRMSLPQVHRHRKLAQVKDLSRLGGGEDGEVSFLERDQAAGELE
jgi:hypothetical protein